MSEDEKGSNTRYRFTPGRLDLDDDGLKDYQRKMSEALAEKMTVKWDHLYGDQYRKDLEQERFPGNLVDQMRQMHREMDRERAEAEDSDFNAIIGEQIELHEDVEEFLEMTGHSVRIELRHKEDIGRIPWRERIAVVQALSTTLEEYRYHPPSVRWDPLNNSHIRPETRPKAIHHAYCTVEMLVREPEKSIALIQDVVDRQRSEYEVDRDVVDPPKFYEGRKADRFIFDDPHKDDK